MRVDKTKWEKRTFSQIGDSQLGKTLDSNKNKGNPYPYLCSVNVGYGEFYLSNIKEILLEDNELERYLVKNGDLLICEGGETGRCAIWTSEKPIYYQNALHRVRCKEGINNRFIMYTLHYYKKTGVIDKLSHGQTIKHFTQKGLNRLVFNIPTIDIQQAIASELDAIQTMIDGYKAQLEDLDALAQSIFLDMFGDPVSNPKGWKKESLNKYASIGTGATPSRKIISYYEGDIPWVKSTEVHNSYILETQEHITQEAIDNSNCSIYLPNTILVAMYGQGKTRGQVGLLKIEAATNQACAAVRCKESLNPIFCYWHFQMCYEANRDLGNGTNQKNMNLTIVGNIKFIIPPLTLQQQFATRVEQIEQQKEQIRLQLKDAETLMAERMQHYFS